MCIYCLTSGRQNRWSLVPCWISGSLLTRSCKGPEIWLSHMNDIQQEILTVVMCSSVISSLTPHLISTTCEGGIGSLGGKKKKRIPGTQAHVSPCSTPWSWGRRIPSSSSSPSTYQWMWSLWRSAQPVKISVSFHANQVKGKSITMTVFTLELRLGSPSRSPAKILSTVSSFLTGPPWHWET